MQSFVSGNLGRLAAGIPTPPTSPNVMREDNLNLSFKLAASNSEALSAALARVRHLADVICGAVPRDAGADEGRSIGGGLVDHLTALFGREQEVIAAMHYDLTRIESKLGIDQSQTSAGSSLG